MASCACHFFLLYITLKPQSRLQELATSVVSPLCPSCVGIYFVGFHSRLHFIRIGDYPIGSAVCSPILPANLKIANVAELPGPRKETIQRCIVCMKPYRHIKLLWLIILLQTNALVVSKFEGANWRVWCPIVLHGWKVLCATQSHISSPNFRRPWGKSVSDYFDCEVAGSNSTRIAWSLFSRHLWFLRWLTIQNTSCCLCLSQI